MTPNFFLPSKICVTGANGFASHYLVQAFVIARFTVAEYLTRDQ